MRDDFGALFAASPSTLRRDPTPAEVAGGLACGAAGRDFWNELIFGQSSVLSELKSVLSAAQVVPDETKVNQLLTALNTIIAAQSRTTLSVLKIPGNNLLFDQSAPGTYTFTVPDKVDTIYAQAWGPGGTGGGSYGSGSAGAGGGGGGYADGRFAVTPGQTITIVLGGPGAQIQGSSASGGDAGAGTATSVGALLYAAAGNPGKGGLNVISQTSGGGGTATGGQTQRPGGSGGTGTSIASSPLSGIGGYSFQSSTAPANQSSATLVGGIWVGGSTGTFPGGGGAGSAYANGGAGGIGGLGWVRIFG